MEDKGTVLVNDNLIQNLVDSNPNKIGNISDGRYLYGDYSPINPNLNLLDLISDFISTTENVLQIHQHISTLESLLTEITDFEEIILTKYRDFEEGIKESINNFNIKNSIKFKDLISIKQINENWIDEEIFTGQMKESEIYHKKIFNENKLLIKSQIMEYSKNSFLLLQLWLLNESSPFKLSDKNSSIFDIRLIIDNNKEIYQSSLIYQLIGQNYDISKNMEKIQCSLHLNPIGKFGNGKIKLLDIFLTPILIPVGFKRSISNKIKNSFRLVTNEIVNIDEPEYISITNFFVVNIRKEFDSISLILSNEPTQVNQKIIKIIFDINWNPLPFETSTKDDNYQGKKPLIYYKGNGKTQKEVEISHEFNKFIDLKLMIKLKNYLNDVVKAWNTNENILTNGQLHSLEYINNKHVILEQQNNGSLYDKDMVMDFLENSAYFFTNIIKTITEKSPVKNELLIRYEEKDKPRKEFVIKTNDLAKQLSNSDEGKEILSIINLEIQSNEV